ncbi:MAG: hypothetical protein ACTSVZ_09595 [Promethearchaeota archaeon]
MFTPKSSKSPKMPRRKNDAAPMLFFIDQIKSSMFENPILPMPLRIDRLLIQRSSLFIIPTKRALIQTENKKYTFDYVKIYSLFMENLLRYAEQKYRTLFYRQMDLRIVENWWNQTKILQSRIHGFNDLQGEILQSYLDAYQQFLEGKDDKTALIEHIDYIIQLCDDEVKKNSLSIDFKGKKISKPLYKKKANQIHPNIFEVDIYNTKKQKSNRKAFVPLFVYDDLLDCYLFNKLQLDPEGFNAMNDIITPEELEKKKKQSQRSPWWKKKTSDSEAEEEEEGKMDPRAEEEFKEEQENQEEVQLITFSVMEDEGIIIPYQDSMGTTLDSQEILNKINIDEIFDDII